MQVSATAVVEGRVTDWMPSPAGLTQLNRSMPGEWRTRRLELTASVQVDRRLTAGQIETLIARIGSGPASQSPELVARNLPVELGCHAADVRLGRVPTLSSTSQRCLGHLKADARCFRIALEYRGFSGSRGQPRSNEESAVAQRYGLRFQRVASEPGSTATPRE